MDLYPVCYVFLLILLFYFVADAELNLSRGGAGQIADAMISKMSQKVEYGKRVTALATTMNGNHADCVEVTVANELNTRKYSHAITTMPFSCLRLVDTTKCGFNWNLQTAIRALHYDSSVKVAIRFSRRWWEDPKLPGGPHYGGVSSTDRPTRVVVYPSYGIKQNTGATMIVSYTWSQDALRIGALAQGPDSEAETLLLESIVKDLAEMHQVKYESLWKMKLDHKVYDWYSSEYAAGGWCFHVYSMCGFGLLISVSYFFLFFFGRRLRDLRPWAVLELVSGGDQAGGGHPAFRGRSC